MQVPKVGQRGGVQSTYVGFKVGGGDVKPAFSGGYQSPWHNVFVDVHIPIRLDLAKLVVTCSNIQASIPPLLTLEQTYM